MDGGGANQQIRSTEKMILRMYLQGILVHRIHPSQVCYNKVENCPSFCYGAISATVDNFSSLLNYIQVQMLRQIMANWTIE
jgi:hypothetical protein